MVDISDMELVELKAIAYDIVISINKLQNDLQAINQEMAKRNQEVLKNQEKKNKTLKKVWFNIIYNQSFLNII